MRRVPPSRRRGPASGSETVSFDSAQCATLDELVYVFAALHVALGEDHDLEFPIDLVAEDIPELAPLVRGARDLAGTLIASAVGRPAGPARAREPEEVGQLSLGIDAPPMPRDVRALLISEAGELIREVGLERYDASCELFSTKRGMPGLVVEPLPPETAHVRLFERLTRRAELFMRATRLLELERRASQWAFERWSAAPRKGDDAGVAFTRMVREAEWSFVERPLVAVPGTAIEMVTGGKRFRSSTRRLSHLRNALSKSVTGMFEVVETGDSTAIVRDPVTDVRRTIWEHNAPPLYKPGDVMLGRLVPYSRELHLRSPGAVTFEPPVAGMTKRIGDALDVLSRAIPRALAIESLISKVALGRVVPTAARPARSPAEAQALLQELKCRAARGGTSEGGSGQSGAGDDLVALGLRRPSAHRELFAQHLAGGFLAVMTWWLDGGAKLPPRDVDELFRPTGVRRRMSAFTRTSRPNDSPSTPARCSVRSTGSTGGIRWPA